MSIVSKETASRIWSAHNQIDTADKLVKDIEKTIAEGGDPTPYDPHNRHRRGYSLGVPCGSGERILGVNPKLALDVIMAFRSEQLYKLAEASLVAKIELAGDEDLMSAEVEPIPAPVQSAAPDPDKKPWQPGDPPEDLPF